MKRTHTHTHVHLSLTGKRKGNTLYSYKEKLSSNCPGKAVGPWVVQKPTPLKLSATHEGHGVTSVAAAAVVVYSNSGIVEAMEALG